MSMGNGIFHTEETLEEVKKIFDAIEAYAVLLRKKGVTAEAEEIEQELDNEYLDYFEVSRCCTCGNLVPRWETHRYDDECILCYEKSNPPEAEPNRED